MNDISKMLNQTFLQLQNFEKNIWLIQATLIFYKKLLSAKE